jgi:hypothetical protein
MLEEFGAYLSLRECDKNANIIDWESGREYKIQDMKYFFETMEKMRRLQYDLSLAEKQHDCSGIVLDYTVQNTDKHTLSKYKSVASRILKVLLIQLDLQHPMNAKPQENVDVSIVFLKSQKAYYIKQTKTYDFLSD